jgi:hypothetical protein
MVDPYRKEVEEKGSKAVDGTWEVVSLIRSSTPTAQASCVNLMPYYS